MPVGATWRRDPVRSASGDGVLMRLTELREFGGADGEPPAPGDIPIGIAVPLSGGIAQTGRSIYRGALLAIEEVNAAGGVNGRRLVPVVEDTASSVTRGVQAVRSLLKDQGVRVVVGGYTSADRVAMAPAFHEHDGLLIYPTYFEGLEQDSSVFYAGAVPNQYLGGYLDWIVEHLGRRLYMVGSDYVYPRTAGQIIQRVAAARGATVLADRYVPMGQVEFATILEDIARVEPEVVICNLVGNDSVPAFYRQFHAAGYRAETLPIAATVTSEVELSVMGPEVSQGHFMTASYFTSLQNPANLKHRAAFAARFGDDAVQQVVSTAAYNGVWLLALAARAAGDVSVPALRAALPGTTFDGNPEGHPISFRANHHTTHGSYIGVANDRGEYDVIATSSVREPDPYPELLVPAERRPPQAAPSAVDG